ncbi:hypothetical protein CSKR_109329 [Clonorchis sinensis]|uniref:Uncharacterized protein n=2 Tax=Clonorchis sinensis TaxID=79923 RepID=G7YP33_CLOSI|nr:hypothetical protein CSKR_109329 [Clonorchis sinensis]GAA54714.1 hypothetical protein CLF_105083 [Clonorchis sinensis]
MADLFSDSTERFEKFHRYIVLGNGELNPKTQTQPIIRRTDGTACPPTGVNNTCFTPMAISTHDFCKMRSICNPYHLTNFFGIPDTELRVTRRFDDPEYQKEKLGSKFYGTFYTRCSVNVRTPNNSERNFGSVVWVAVVPSDDALVFPIGGTITRNARKQVNTGSANGHERARVGRSAVHIHVNAYTRVSDRTAFAASFSAFHVQPIEFYIQLDEYLNPPDLFGPNLCVFLLTILYCAQPSSSAEFRSMLAEHRALCILIVHNISNKLCTGCTLALLATAPFVVTSSHVGSKATTSSSYGAPFLEHNPVCASIESSINAPSFRIDFYMTQGLAVIFLDGCEPDPRTSQGDRQNLPPEPACSDVKLPKQKTELSAKLLRLPTKHNRNVHYSASCLVRRKRISRWLLNRYLPAVQCMSDNIAYVVTIANVIFTRLPSETLA